MPAKSKAQLRLMFAVIHGDSTKVPKGVAMDYIAHGKSGKGLPEKVSKQQRGKHRVFRAHGK